MIPTRLLITGFEPFADFAVNPSGEAIAHLRLEFGSELAAHVLPVDFLRAREHLIELLDKHQPRACLCMGLAPGMEFRIERTARKVSQFSHLPGEASYDGTFAFDTITRTLTRLGPPWRFSDDCGLYVCESTYWALLEYAGHHGHPTECGFLHVPAANRSSPLERTIDIIREVVADILRR